MPEAEEDVALDPAPVNAQLVVEPTVVGGPLAGVMGAVVSDEKPFVHGVMIRGGGGDFMGDLDDRWRWSTNPKRMRKRSGVTPHARARGHASARQ